LDGGGGGKGEERGVRKMGPMGLSTRQWGGYVGSSTPEGPRGSWLCGGEHPCGVGSGTKKEKGTRTGRDLNRHKESDSFCDRSKFKEMTR